MSRLAVADTVHQRGGLPSLEGQITNIDDAGVMIKREYAQPDFIRWDMVREVVKDKPDPAIEKYKEDATNLWRARTRLERHDAAAAEPLFERLFEKYRGKSHETALLVTEGLVRCRLAAGSNDLAVIPALEAMRLRRSLSRVNIYSTLPPIFDERTQLCPSLPPVWLVTSNLVKLERDLATYKTDDPAVAAVAALYRRAIAQQLAIRFDESGRTPSLDHPGVALLRTIVDLQAPDAATREAARQSVLRDVTAAANWVQAWTYYFVGQSLLSEGTSQQPQGLVQLAHVPARFGTVQPFLAGLALAALAEACDASGDSAAAASLRSELATRYPNHPVQGLIRRKTAGITRQHTTTHAYSAAVPIKEES